jgi:glycosyltransferase involved in cell wall biosynthesis
MLLENNPYPQDGRVRREALSLTKAGYQVTVISPKARDQSWSDSIDGVRVYRFPPPPEGDGLIGYLTEYGYATVALFLVSLWALVRNGFDVVHTHNPPDTLVLIVAFFKLLGKRFVYDHHDLSPEMYQALFAQNGRSPVHRALVLFEKLSCRLADRVIATNQSYKKIEMERGNVPGERITVVRNGPDLDRLQPVAVDPSLTWPGKATLCYVGDMGHHDGVDYLLRALRRLVDDLGRSDFYCVLVGEGSAWPSLKLMAKELDLMDHVSFTGWIPHTEVNRFLSAADICLAPEPSNAYNDRSTMIKIMEYMALGKPTVAFDLPEHRVTAQDAAVYARPNDELEFARKIAALMDDPVRGRQMGAQGRERAETVLSWPHQEKELLRAYSTLIEQGATR